MGKINFDDEFLINALKKNIPEIKDLLFPEFAFTAYINYGTFGTFLRDQIIAKERNVELIARSFSLLNFLIENGDENILEMLRVQPIEILTDFDETILTAKSYLNVKGVEILEEVKNLLR